MKNKSIYSFLITACIAACTLFSGCEDKNERGKVTAITIQEAVWVAANSSMEISLKDNATLQLTPFIMPRDADNQTVTYSNKHPNLMDISASGLITGKSPGIDTLTVSAADGSGVTVSYRVIISDHMVKATGINVTAAGSNITLKIGGVTFDLGACVTLTPADTWDKAVTYKSNNEAIVTVSANGIVSPAGVGSTTITITTVDGSNISRNVNVTVQDVVQRWDDIDRTTWTATSDQGNGFAYVPDGSTGMVEDLLNSTTSTFLSLLKTGRGANVSPAQPNAPEGVLPVFTVDMKSSQKFNYFRWRHRGNNNYCRLKTFAVHVYGSNDGVNFTQIIPEEPGAPDFPNLFWIPVTTGYVGDSSHQSPDGNNYFIIDTPESNYRYVRIEIVVWSNNYLTTGFQHPDWPGNGDSTYGNSVQISEFGLGYNYWE